MSGGGSTCAYHPRTEPVRAERHYSLRSFRCSTTGRPPGDFGGDGKVKTTGDRLHLLGRLKFEPAVGCDGSIGEPSFLPSNARILTRAATPTLTPPLGTLIAADSAAWPAWAQLAPTQPPPPISSLTSRQAWVAGGCRQPATAASRAALERLPLCAAVCGRRRLDALNISTPRVVTCLRPRPGNGVRFPGGGPGALPLRSRSRRAWPRLEPSAYLSHSLPSTPRWPLCM